MRSYRSWWLDTGLMMRTLIHPHWHWMGWRRWWGWDWLNCLNIRSCHGRGHGAEWSHIICRWRNVVTSTCALVWMMVEWTHFLIHFRIELVKITCSRIVIVIIIFRIGFQIVDEVVREIVGFERRCCVWVVEQTLLVSIIFTRCNRRCGRYTANCWWCARSNWRRSQCSPIASRIHRMTLWIVHNVHWFSHIPFLEWIQLDKLSAPLKHWPNVNIYRCSTFCCVFVFMVLRVSDPLNCSQGTLIASWSRLLKEIKFIFFHMKSVVRNDEWSMFIGHDVQNWFVHLFTVCNIEWSRW